MRYDVLLKLGVAGFYLGDHRAAIDRWHHAARLKPEMAEPHYNMGLAYDALERHAEAVARYERAAALQPDNADILYSLAQSHARLGRYVEAIAAYGSALQLAPSAEGYADFGRILQISGRPEESEGGLRTVSAADARPYTCSRHPVDVETLIIGVYSVFGRIAAQKLKFSSVGMNG